MLASLHSADREREPDRRSSADAIRQCFSDTVNRVADGGESIVVQQHKKPIAAGAQNRALPCGLDMAKHLRSI